jgi:hypothetical protein
VTLSLAPLPLTQWLILETMSQLFGELQRLQTANQQLRSENQRMRVEIQASKHIERISFRKDRALDRLNRLMLREAFPGSLYVAALIKREKVNPAHQGPKNRH